MLHNIRITRPLLTQKADQVLVISRLDYCNSLLAALPAKAIRPLQLIQNAAARRVFSLPKFTRTAPLRRSLHGYRWSSIRFITLVLGTALRTDRAPSTSWMWSHRTPHHVRSAPTANRLVTPSLRAHPSTSRLVAVLAPDWWNELPTDIRTAGSLHIFTGD